MEYPVCMDDRRVGTLYVRAAGGDTDLRAVCRGAEKGLFYYGNWIRVPGVAICSCNDGLRPVIFKLEATDETSEINYTPVR